MTDAAGRHEQPAGTIRVTVASPVTDPVTIARRDRGDREETGDGSYFAPLAKARYFLLTTFKQKGTPVSAVVQGVADGDRAYFRVRSRSGTARRLRHTDGVQVAPCRALGVWSYGPPLDAAARPLAGEEAGRVAGQLDRKYPVRHRSLAWPVHRAWRRRLAYYELLLGDRGGPQRRDRHRLDVRRGRGIGSRGRQGWLVSTTWPDEAGLPSSGSRVTVIVG